MEYIDLKDKNKIYLGWFDEIHICRDSEYGVYLTFIDNFNHINLLNEFIDEEELSSIFDFILNYYIKALEVKNEKEKGSK